METKPSDGLSCIHQYFHTFIMGYVFILFVIRMYVEIVSYVYVHICELIIKFSLKWMKMAPLSNKLQEYVDYTCFLKHNNSI